MKMFVHFICRLKIGGVRYCFEILYTYNALCKLVKSYLGHILIS